MAQTAISYPLPVSERLVSLRRTDANPSARFYRPELDALRFFAFLAVFFHHTLHRDLNSVIILHAWLGRSSMNPDGVSYLDVGDAFVHHNWAVAINAWWSPLYAWTLGVVLHAVGASPQREF